MMEKLQVISPVDGKVYVELDAHDPHAIDRVLERAKKAHKAWRTVSLPERMPSIQRFIDAFVESTDRISTELAWQMGRPLRFGPNEVGGTRERTLGMLDLAESALADLYVGEKPGFRRFIRHQPLGTVFVVPAWNYPYLIAVNSIVPALLAGNAVILKHSAQTPLVAERFADAFAAAGLPDGLFQFLHLTHRDTAAVIRDPRVDFVAFTGSVAGGHQIQKTAADRFIGVGLELGGKDPAYVAADADLAFSVENLVDGSFYNSGQSCCGIERIYVHESLYDDFVAQFVALTEQYKLGNPLDPETNLGPVAKKSGADLVRRHIDEAVRSGARALVDAARFPQTELGPTYLTPQVLVDVDHTMAVMIEESFGPV
ncbi:aldehyde dehydrogenase family protein, partial [candidate division KSB1 bacterium]|nr:aldehyde dehydrogenase family protein [candidate division KSB1 bacterium]